MLYVYVTRVFKGEIPRMYNVNLTFIETIKSNKYSTAYLQGFQNKLIYKHLRGNGFGRGNTIYTYLNSNYIYRIYEFLFQSSISKVNN